MAVAGDPESRKGIVVAKNELAKKAGVKTTDTVYQAQRKCPGIVFVPPRHHFYSEISKRVNAIYLEYTDLVEPASIDESYLDVTGTITSLMTTPALLADELRRRMREEIGITISVGVSFCKVLAKMGSDYKKPDATTIITTLRGSREMLPPEQVGLGPVRIETVVGSWTVTPYFMHWKGSQESMVAIWLTSTCASRRARSMISSTLISSSHISATLSRKDSISAAL